MPAASGVLCRVQKPATDAQQRALLQANSLLIAIRRPQGTPCKSNRDPVCTDLPPSDPPAPSVQISYSCAALPSLGLRSRSTLAGLLSACRVRVSLAYPPPSTSLPHQLPQGSRRVLAQQPEIITSWQASSRLVLKGGRSSTAPASIASAPASSKDHRRPGGIERGDTVG